jgi:glycosyltransferase involved in cell wall biosynthesis
VRILLVTQFFPPETTAAANRLGVMVDTLADEHDVTVLTLNPSYPSADFHIQAHVAAFDSGKKYSVLRSGIFEQVRGSFLIRGIKEYKMCLSLYREACRRFREKGSFDVVIVSSPSMFLGVPGILLSRKFSAKLFWDIRDVTWRYARDSLGKGLIHRCVARVLEMHMSFLLKKSYRIWAATEGIASVVVDCGVPSDRVKVVPNGLARELFEKIVQGTLRQRQYRGKIVVTYVGVVGINQGLKSLVDAAYYLPEIEFVLVGEGVDKINLEEYVRSKKINNVTFKGFLDRDKVVGAYSDADILFAQLKDNESLNNTAVPSKLFEYMSTGKPIVYAGKGVAADILLAHEVGFLAEPQNVDSIVSAIKKASINVMAGVKGGGVNVVESNYIREDIFSLISDDIRSAEVV